MSLSAANAAVIAKLFTSYGPVTLLIYWIKFLLPKVKPILKPAKPAVFERDWIISILLFFSKSIDSRRLSPLNFSYSSSTTINESLFILAKLIISWELRTVPVGLFGLQININFGLCCIIFSLNYSMGNRNFSPM